MSPRLFLLRSLVGKGRKISISDHLGTEIDPVQEDRDFDSDVSTGNLT